MTSRLVRQSLLAASLITIGTSLLSRFFGYAREAVVASYFGTSHTLDIFILAFTVPELISFVAFAALPMALIPSLRASNSRSPDAQSCTFWGGLLGFLVIFGILSTLVYSLRSNILLWLAPSLDPAARYQGENLLATVAPFIFFRGMEAYFRSWLFEKKHFIVPATSAIITNVVILCVLFGLYGKLNVSALAYGWLAASIVLFAYNAVFAFMLVRPSAPSQTDLAPIVLLMKASVSIAVVESIALIYPVVDRYLAAKYLGEGQIAALRYATFLIHIPTGILIVAFSQASFPWISDLSDPAATGRFKKLYRESIRLIFFVMGLVAAGVVVFSSEIVKLAFQRGAFDVNSQALTSSPLMFFALGVVFYSVYFFQIRYYYARMSLRRLGSILCAMLLLKILLSLALVGPMEQDGLALATALTWLCGFIIMTVDLGRGLRVSLSELLGKSIWKILLSISGVAGFWVAVARLWQGGAGEWMLMLFVRLSVFAVAGVLLYLGLARLFKLTELRGVFDAVRERVHPDDSEHG